jgi:hypothetical protein
MTTLTRRHVLAGAAAMVAAVALPAAAAVSDDYVMTPAVAKLLADMGAWTGITWGSIPPSRRCAVWWEDRLHALLWKRVRDQRVCLGPIVDPVISMLDDGGVQGLETYVQAVPKWVLDYALAEDETDDTED